MPVAVAGKVNVGVVSGARGGSSLRLILRILCRVSIAIWARKVLSDGRFSVKIDVLELIISNESLNCYLIEK